MRMMQLSSTYRMVTRWMAAAVAILASSLLFGSSAQATVVIATKTLTAPNQSYGTRCSEIRVTAAFAFNDRTAFTASCVGHFSANKYMIVNRNDVVYVGAKFYNPTLKKWRITVAKRM